MTIPLDSIENMPAFSPYYPMPPARYRNVRFQYVCFHADPAAVDRVLPACFAPADDGFCAAIGIAAPWTGNYGAFEESVLVVKCLHEGQTGYFAPVVFLNSRGSIPAGREIYGTPKVFADMTVAMEERVMVTEARVADTAIMTVRSTMHRPAATEDLPNLLPAWRLKVIPRADGKGAEVMQLIDASTTMSEVTTHVARAGDGIVQFNPSPIYDLSDFTPRTYLGAYYAEMDYTEGHAEIVKDFRKERGTGKA